MSVLVVGNDSPLVRVLVTRLVEQGDEVRAVDAGPIRAAALEALGVHIARGPYLDADLIERAGQNCRTLVGIELDAELLEEVVAGMSAAGIPRFVVCGRALDAGLAARLDAAGLDYVILRTPARRLLRTPIPDDRIAESIDAADDIGGHPRFALDLGDESSWDALGLRSESSG